MIGPNRLHGSRPQTVRLMLVQACKQLNSTSKSDNGYHSVQAVLQQVENIKPPNEPPVGLNEMMEICDTEGNAQNGGGSFATKNEGPRGMYLKFESDNGPNGPRGSIAAGEIGSPVPGHTMPTFGGGGIRPFQPSGISPPTGF